MTIENGDFSAVTETELQRVEYTLLTAPPRSVDSLLRNYFLYCTGQMNMIADGLTLPAVIFGRTVSTIEELKKAYQNAHDFTIRAIQARGRDSYDQPGMHFWDSSSSDDIGYTLGQLGKADQKAYDTLKSK